MDPSVSKVLIEPWEYAQCLQFTVNVTLELGQKVRSDSL